VCGFPQSADLWQSELCEDLSIVCRLRLNCANDLDILCGFLFCERSPAAYLCGMHRELCANIAIAHTMTRRTAQKSTDGYALQSSLHNDQTFTHSSSFFLCEGPFS